MVEQIGPLDELPDQELAALCAQRPIHEEAWATFYERFRNFVQRQVRWRLGDSAREADDVTQEAFTKIFRVLPSFDPDKSQLKTYISRVITSVTIDHFRHNAASANTTSLTDEVGVLQIQAIQNPEILREAAERIVQQLPDTDKAELILDLLHGKDVKEICESRRLTEYHVYGARNWLRKRLRDIYADFPSY